MRWVVAFHPEFESEFEALPKATQDELLSRTGLLEEFGPTLGRPNVDTLQGSTFPNMKELRFRLDDGLWRFAFAFDPHRQGIILVGGNKVGDRRFYKELIGVADKRFAAHVANLGPADRRSKQK